MIWVTALAFFTPIVLVLIMYMFNDVFKGWKTNTQGILIAVFAALPTMNLSFIPQDTANAMLAGAGLAVLIASKLTERA